MKDFSKLEKDLKLEFKDKDLLTQAFCHRSYLNENSNFSLEHNERLEFLGDAVLELVVTKLLYLEYPKTSEGELTAWRAALVNADSLAQAARELNFNDYLIFNYKIWFIYSYILTFKFNLKSFILFIFYLFFSKGYF